MTAPLADKVCLVTGASRGIGAAVAEMMADQGARVVVHYGKGKDAACKVVDRLAGQGHIALRADFGKPDCAPELIQRVVSAMGRIDVLVNNAGIYQAHPPLATAADEWLEKWNRILAVNLVAPAALCHAVAQVMAEQGGGRIINVGSRGAFRGEPDGPAYGASKAGLHAMSQSLAVALAPRNIQVFAVAPGFVETDMARPLLDSSAGEGIRAQSPMMRVARPDEVAEVVCFLAGTGAGFMTGAIIDVNGASYLRS